MSILQFVWIGDLDETKTQRLQNPQALSYDRCHPKKMTVRQDKKETRIGRKNSKMPPDYALESAVSNRMISRNHVTIERLSKGNYMLYDHSLNGTYVNFVRVIGGTILKHEDIVCFGHINGANIKPGESVTPFATDLKYRVEIIDKIGGAGLLNDKSSGSVRKSGENYSHSESSQYEEAPITVASDQKQYQKKIMKHKSQVNERAQSKKSIKPVKHHHDTDDSGQSSDSSYVSNNNHNNYKKQKKHADLSSLSSSDDDRLKSLNKDRQQFNKKVTITDKQVPPTSSQSSKKHSSMSESSRFNELAVASARKRKIGNENNAGSNTINSKSSSANMTSKKSAHESKSRSSIAKNDDDRRSIFQSSAVKDRKMHLNQKSSSSTASSHAKPKYSDTTTGGGIGVGGGGTIANSNSNNNSGSKSNSSLSKRNVNVNSNYDYEECSARPCLRPDGENPIDWIMCDKCTQWFHQSCVGLDEAVEDDESYYCPYCARQ